MPMNYLLIQALQTLSEYYKDDLQVELPTESGNLVSLDEVSDELARRLVAIFQKDELDKRKVHADHSVYQHDEHFKNLVLFYEYFHGDTSRGVGASHQTGWTGLVAALVNKISIHPNKEKNDLVTSNHI
jgi:hypothetical protein